MKTIRLPGILMLFFFMSQAAYADERLMPPPARADGETHDQMLAQAQQTLKDAREMAGDLRKWNGNSIFGVNLYAYHHEIKKLQHDAPTLFTQPQPMMLMMARVGKLEYIVEKLDSDAPFYLSSSIEFDKLISEAQASVATLRKAVLEGKSARVLEAIQKLKDPYE